jgi:hypothetical protein
MVPTAATPPRPSKACCASRWSGIPPGFTWRVGPRPTASLLCSWTGWRGGEGDRLGPGCRLLACPGRGAVLPPSRMREREQTAPPGRGGGGAAAAAMWLGPSSWSALSASSWLRVRPRAVGRAGRTTEDIPEPDRLRVFRSRDQSLPRTSFVSGGRLRLPAGARTPAGGSDK